jgi:hypothetical protein
MANRKATSSRVASTASKILSNPKSSTTAKKLAGSALSQVNKTHETSAELEKLASKVLDNPQSSVDAKTLAASILSQSKK